MINLSNLKAGQVKTVGDVTVTKEDDGYKITANEGSGKIYYDRDAKAWMAVLNMVNYQLDDANAKTAVEIALDKLASQTPVEPEVVPETITRPAPEINADDFNAMLEEVAAEDADVDEVEIAETIEESVSVKGGLGPHRAAVYATLAAALGGTFSKHKEKGVGYQGALTVTISGPEGVPTKVVEVARLILAKAEQEMGPELSRAASRRTRLGGIHHSAGGYYARAGLLRGLAKGVGVLLAGEESDWLEEADLGSGRYEEAAYAIGQETAPAIKDQVLAAIG